jgi:hypothetical protein
VRFGWSEPENIVWIERSTVEGTAGKTSITATTGVNLLFRFKRGGFTVSEQDLKPFVIADTDRGLHWVGGIETKGILQTPIIYHVHRVEDGNIRLTFIYCLLRAFLPAEGQNL